MKAIRQLKHNIFQRITAEKVLNKVGLLDRDNINSLLRATTTDRNTVFGNGTISITSAWGFKLEKENFWVQRKDAQNVYGMIQVDDILLSVDSSDAQDRYDLIQGRYSIVDADLESVEIIDPIAGTLGVQNFYTSKKTNIQVNVVKGTPGSGVSPSLTQSGVASIIGTQDLSPGVDLSLKYNLTIAIDGGSYITVNCQGATPSATSLAEIVSAINAAFGITIAYANGNFLEIRSILTGDDGKVELKPPTSNDALNIIFGLTETISYYYPYFGEIGYFKIGEIRITGSSTLLVADDIRGISRTSEWTVDPNSNSISKTLQQHKDESIIDHPNSSVTRVKIADEAVGTEEIESTDNAKKIQRVNVANEAIGTNQIEKTNDANKIKNDNVGEFEVGISKYHHLLHNNGRWFQPEAFNRFQKELNAQGRCVFRDMNSYGGFNQNGMIVLHGNDGGIYRYDMKTGAFIDSYLFSMPDGLDGVQVDYEGNSYYLFMVFGNTPPYNVIRVVSVNSVGIPSAVITYSTSNFSRLYAHSMVIHNDFVYISINGSLTTNGLYVDKQALGDVIAGGGTWTNVRAFASPARLAGITIDPISEIFYVVRNDIANQRILTFLDDGSANYATSPDFGVPIAQHIQFYQGSIYTTQGTANSAQLRAVRALQTYDETWINNVRIDFKWFSEEVTGVPAYLMNFKIYDDGLFMVSSRQATGTLGVGSVQHYITLSPKESDSGNSFMGFIIGEKAHIINDTWRVDVAQKGIDLVNHVGGIIDGLPTYLSGGITFYQIWAFADVNNIFKGFGLTRVPNFWMSSFNFTTSVLQGQQFTITAASAKFTNFLTPGDKDEDAVYPLSHFTVGATIRIMRDAINDQTFGTTRFRTAKIISIDETQMVCETIFNNDPAADAGVVQVVQLNNFRPYVNGDVQNTLHPKFKLVSQCFRLNRIGDITEFYFSDWKTIRFRETTPNAYTFWNGLTFFSRLGGSIQPTSLFMRRMDSYIPPSTNADINVFGVTSAFGVIHAIELASKSINKRVAPSFFSGGYNLTPSPGTVTMSGIGTEKFEAEAIIIKTIASSGNNTLILSVKSFKEDYE